MRPRIRNVDSIRFIAALFVYFSHGGAPFWPSGLPEAYAAQLYMSVWNGIGAVMVFFIVSGFCIHLPQVGKTSFDITAFAIKRTCRIAIPAAVIMTLLFGADWWSASTPATPFWRRPYFHGFTSVAWSLIAEFIYYCAYPLFFKISAKIGMRALLALSILLALLIHKMAPASGPYHWQHSILAMAALGLPLWLTGCVLAERGVSRTRKTWHLAAWRFIVLAYLTVANFEHLFTNFRISHPLLYLPFAWIAYRWLALELGEFDASSKMLEKIGESSFTLYMAHKPLLYFCGTIPTSHPWLFQSFIVAFGTLAFAWAVEWPAQRLGQSLARAATRPAQGAPYDCLTPRDVQS